MELQQPTLEKRVLAIELPSGLRPLPRALNNSLNWFPTPIFIFASESRAIIDYDSWISLINSALGLSQLMYRIPPVHATHVQRHPKALKTDDFLYRSFHPIPHLTFCWFGTAQFQLRGFSGSSGKCFLKNPGFGGKPEVFIKQVGKARVSAHALQIRKIL